MEKLSGIYEIICNVTNVHYVGKSKNIYQRWRSHLEDLRGNKHHSIYLQRAWNKYGEKKFEFKIIELVIPSKLKKRENFYLKNNVGKFNMMLSSGGVLFHSDESRKKMTKGQIKHWKKRRREGRVTHNKKTKAAISKSHIGIRPNKKSKKKMSISAKKRGMAHLNNKKRCKKGHLFSKYRDKYFECSICSKERKKKWHIKNMRKKNAPTKYKYVGKTLKKGSVIKRIKIKTKGLTIGKKYVVTSIVKYKYSDFKTVYYKNDFGKLTKLSSLRNWEIVKI